MVQPQSLGKSGMRRFVVPLDKQERWSLCKRGGKGTVRPQVRYDGSAVGLPEGLESCAEPEEQGKGSPLDMGSP